MITKIAVSAQSEGEVRKENRRLRQEDHDLLAELKIATSSGGQMEMEVIQKYVQKVVRGFSPEN